MYETGKTATEMNAGSASKQYLSQARGLDAPVERGVRQALARLHSAKNDVRMNLESMGQRLDPIMAPPGPEKASGSTGGPPTPQSSAIFSDINEVAADLEATAQAMRAYMQRLEV